MRLKSEFLLGAIEPLRQLKASEPTKRAPNPFAGVQKPLTTLQYLDSYKGKGAPTKRRKCSFKYSFNEFVRYVVPKARTWPASRRWMAHEVS